MRNMNLNAIIILLISRYMHIDEKCVSEYKVVLTCIYVAHGCAWEYRLQCHIKKPDFFFTCILLLIRSYAFLGRKVCCLVYV